MSNKDALVSFVVLIVIGVTARLLPHLPNFAPVTATALFCGAYMNRRYSILAPLLIMLASDYALLYISPYSGVHLERFYPPWTLWHTTLLYVYGSFALSAVIGWLATRRGPVWALPAALVCSVQFFLITNAGVWLAGAYPRGLDGLWQSYVAGLPFFRGTVTGDLVYTAAFFGLYELVRASRVMRAPTPPAVGEMA